jgi:CRISPR associated protein Cas1
MGCVFPKAVKQPIPASLRVGSDGRLKVLESQVRMHIVAEGCDPTIGFLHVERPAFVFDLMEPLRPIVHRAMLTFVQSHTFHPADFTIRSDGVCRLNPEMAGRVVKLVSATPGLRIEELPASEFFGRLDSSLRRCRYDLV